MQINDLFNLVGAAGFEFATPCAQDAKSLSAVGTGTGFESNEVAVNVYSHETDL